MDALRLFVAVLLPESWLAVLAGVQRELRGAGLELRYVRPEGIHVTLRFLGETPRSRVAGIEGALAASVVGMRPFDIRLDAMGIFGTPRRPRVVWAGLEHDEGSLDVLRASIEDALVGAGIEREGRPFRPHLTIARVPDRLSGAEAAGIAPVVEEVGLFDVPAHRVESIALMRSELGPGGARYTVVNSWRLDG